ncbi:peroxisomal succinyl-coenzyme A thioesterase-like [Lepeophtheirus salmonis]|uniref:peroxisomal succinyl-coenzyme A thioesterase-like n=1 Tax=Lepeophtheirus salmonis TaxID=72036 RepID=UPI003AF3AE24
MKHKGIGLLGLSKGGDIVQTLACLRPDVIGAICIQNGACVSILTSLTKNGVSMGELAQLNYDNVKLRSDDSMDISKVVLVPHLDSKLNIPIENFPGNVLWIAGEDDKNFLSVDFAKNAETRAKESGKNNFELVVYPGMGHFVRLPFTPLTKYTAHPLLPKGVLVYYGGEPNLQAKGQENAWHKKIQFFKKSLV